MNLSSRTAAGRSRSADGDLFSLQNVVHPTKTLRSTQIPISPHGWKRGHQDKIWSNQGPKGLAARSVLALLLWHADANGRVWLGIQAIANKIGAGSLRTVRNALDSLVQQGWLRSTSHTWATLSAEQTAAGRPVPRRGDEGQAPNLYVLLDGTGKSAGSDEPSPAPVPRRPGLARVSSEQSAASTPGHNDQGGPLQKWQGVPRADLPDDLDPKGSGSKMVGDENPRQGNRDTHLFSKIRVDGSGWSKTWKVIVEAHTEKTKSVYGVPPLPPDLKRAQQQALAECLEGAALDVRAKWQARTGVAREIQDVQSELTTRVMHLYFKRDNEHLRRVKHALRDLPREFHARITEAMQLMLRESVDEQSPRPLRRNSTFVETTSLMKPTVPVPSVDAGQGMTIREARRLLEVLNGAAVIDESDGLMGQDRARVMRRGA